MSKWAMRALVPIVGSNEQQLEQIITHQLFGKVKNFSDHRFKSDDVCRQKLRGGRQMVRDHRIVGYY